MGRLFGTDGVRGVANTELTCELAMNIGKAAAMVLINDEVKHPTFLIGKDTRLSGDMLEGALIAGLCSVGANVKLLGVIPTPAVAYLVGKYKADAGIMISASHNPFEFNGIKIFNEDGYKLPDDLEEEIEAIVLDGKIPYSKPDFEYMGTVSIENNAVADYVEHVKCTIENDLSGMEIALDCSNGSASRTAKLLFEGLGAKCHMLFDQPNGININDECGSTHMEHLMDYVREHKLDAGLAFDGDADRCLAVDDNGNLVDGDYVMAICALDMKSRGKLKKDTVVGTIMTNMGFNRFCAVNELNFVSTKVGDRYVLETMLREGYNIGGEQSGHIIFSRYAATGDGILTSLMVMEACVEKKSTLCDLAKEMKVYPQILRNVRVADKKAARENPKVKEAVEAAARALGTEGRILVRESGTEPLIRVMVEAGTEDICAEYVNSVVKVLEAEGLVVE